MQLSDHFWIVIRQKCLSISGLKIIYFSFNKITICGLTKVLKNAFKTGIFRKLGYVRNDTSDNQNLILRSYWMCFLPHYYDKWFQNWIRTIRKFFCLFVGIFNCWSIFHCNHDYEFQKVVTWLKMVQTIKQKQFVGRPTWQTFDIASLCSLTVLTAQLSHDTLHSHHFTLHAKFVFKNWPSCSLFVHFFS